MNTSQLDLRELLAFKPKGGMMSFLGMRVQFSDQLSHGVYRSELIDSLGSDTARAILTRTGFARGWLLAKQLKQHCPEAWSEAKEGRLGPRISAMLGYGEIISSVRTDGLNGKPLVDCHFVGTFEAELQLRFRGVSVEEACWEKSGVASGFVSYVQGRTVYFIEHECQAQGHPYCHFIGRYVEEWSEEFSSYLSYFRGISGKDVDANTSGATNDFPGLIPRFESPCTYTRVGEQPISSSDLMLEVIGLAQRVSSVATSVLVSGESGSGKEVLVRYIHNLSPRKEQPFVAINCGALTDSVIEGELFGYVKGAFTGADVDKVGLIESANGGTLFLDEVGELPLTTQVKLLRVIQEREVRRIGDTKTCPVDLRIISATNVDLIEAVKKGKFRQDLYYRLNIIEINLPPLRHRTEDILPICRHYLAHFSHLFGREIVGLSIETVDLLLNYSWPGNVRELVNAIEHAVVLGKESQITPADLPTAIQKSAEHAQENSKMGSLEDVERSHIAAVLHNVGHNKTAAAKLLKISTATLYRKLKLYHLECE
ncbi:sigma-54-dependent Fis family transcriptional regulator [Shewanella psychrotolerans]|uniref:sigma-54-dependent Fis family transcriptional regulator n=1 Tax=Shewanella psychrotolerans TaxID=2864206 RepID=UPI001C65B89C|nr:sigma-54-dependent Fis family transcriptional regulator [Shewanella psychrotolerans]QYK01374.1 sigma 54-interacting transcriptional regulator [Shewanella psychrotolerans]